MNAGYVGRRMVRKEDARLLSGAGRYVADVVLPFQCHGVVLRSPHAHAALRSIDVGAARAVPGVLMVLTGADCVADGLGAIAWEIRPPTPPDRPELARVALGDPAVAPPQPILALDRVRYVGEPVAFVVAESLEAARDGAEAVVVAYDSLPAIVDTAGAIDPSAPRLWPQFSDNVCFTLDQGDRAATAAAFAGAAHVVRLRLVNNRLVQNPIETRGYVGAYDAATGRYTLRMAGGKPQVIGRQLARDIFRLPVESVRAIAEDVGGGFGAKNVIYAEEVLVAWAARRVGRPVRWIADRSEGFASDHQARDQVTDAALALDADGRFLALSVDTIAGLGAYLAPRGVTPPTAGARMVTGVYHVPTHHYRVRAVHTNTVPTAPYRGAGQPEATYIMERLIDLAARRTGIDAIALRRRNLIPPEAMPYTTLLGTTIDSGEFAANMDAALRLADREGFAARRADARRRGRLRGFGIANALEACGHGVDETAEVDVRADGTVSVRIGTMSNGQSHETVFAQLCADALGIDTEAVTLVQGDSDKVPWGNGTGASRSLTVGGAAIVRAAERVIEKGRAIAAHLLEAAGEDIAFADGRYTVVGTDRSITLRAVATAAADPARLPPGMAPGLTERMRYEPVHYTFPNGCHAAEVEIDPETGTVTLERYVAVHDVGRAVNPAVVEGQLVGGIVQGIGQALVEDTVYDPATGQLLAGSFLDYAMPRADLIPDIRTEIREVPCRHTPLGVKSAGEAGPTSAPPTIVNAIVDALAPLGIDHIDMPATPQRIRAAIAARTR